MKKKSLNINWGTELKELGYTYKKANHFDKKYKKHWLCIDYDFIGYILMFRILRIDPLQRTKCIKRIDIEDMSSLTQTGFMKMVEKIEDEFKALIDIAEQN